MKQVILGIVLAVLSVALVHGADVTQKSGFSVTDGARNNALRDLTVTDVPAIITELNAVNGVTDGTAAVDATTVSAEGLVTVDADGDAGEVLIDVSPTATGANTNILLDIGTTGLIIGDDGDGTLVETNTAAAAEYSIRIRIGGAIYNILLEKP